MDRNETYSFSKVLDDSGKVAGGKCSQCDVIAKTPEDAIRHTIEKHIYPAPKEAKGGSGINIHVNLNWFDGVMFSLVLINVVSAFIFSTFAFINVISGTIIAAAWSWAKTRR